jgi:glutamate synthase (NADPH/NADH) large chain
LLGREEFGFATSALIVLGCVIDAEVTPQYLSGGRWATQNEELRRRGLWAVSEYLIHFLHVLAQVLL